MDTTGPPEVEKLLIASAGKIAEVAHLFWVSLIHKGMGVPENRELVELDYRMSFRSGQYKTASYSEEYG